MWKNEKRKKRETAIAQTQNTLILLDHNQDASPSMESQA